MKNSKQRQNELKDFPVYAKIKMLKELENYLNRSLEDQFDYEDYLFCRDDNSHTLYGYCIPLESFLRENPTYSTDTIITYARDILAQNGYQCFDSTKDSDIPSIQKIIDSYEGRCLPRISNYSIYFVHGNFDGEE